jgi:SAM-dependent methyltransferase
MRESIFERLIASLRRYGVRMTLNLCVKNIAEEFRWYLDRSFDRKYGTETSGRIELSLLNIDSPNVAEGIYYEATSTKTFNYLLAHLSVDFRDFEFIDMGSGKGRTLLLASRYPFKKIVGIEFARELHQVACRNVEVFRNLKQQVSNIDLRCMDAADFVFPTSPFVLYMFNPFKRDLMNRVGKNLAERIREGGQDVILIYHNSNKREMFEEMGCFTEVLAVTPPYDISRKHQSPAAIFATSPGLIRVREPRLRALAGSPSTEPAQ